MEEDGPYFEFALANRETHCRAVTPEESAQGLDLVTGFLDGTWPERADWFACLAKDGQSTHYIRRASVVSFRYVVKVAP